MYQKSLLLALPAALLLQGCQTTSTHPQNAAQTAAANDLSSYYSQQQRKTMTYCVGLADVTHAAAQHKLKGTPKQQLLDQYPDKERSKMHIATIERTYADQLNNPWQYTINFFEQCAERLAEVDAARVNHGSYCHQNAMIAGEAQKGRQRDWPIDKMTAVFSSYNSPTPGEIVERIYASELSRSQAKLSEWQRCITPISNG